MSQAVRLYRIAGRCFKGMSQHKSGRLVLSLLFKSVLGIQRIFHFETINDPGFAVLTGGTNVLSRNILGSLVRSVPLDSVQRLMRETQDKIKKITEILISIDEHAIARFTRKFSIPKGFHTIRNKKMKVEMLFFAFDIVGRKLLTLISTTGDSRLAMISKKMMPTLRRRARGSVLRLILDAGATKDYGVLLDLVNHPRQVTIVRVPRRKGYREKWESIPDNCWTRLEEKGPYKGAPPKVIHLTETETLLKANQGDGSIYQVNVRTVVVREEGRSGKDRWHALWVFRDNTTPAWDIICEYRQRQHNEQRYRILVHDAFVDTAPSGYKKNSVDPKDPDFNGNALTLYGWIAAVASNILEDLSHVLPKRFLHAHPRTLRRWFLNVPGEMYLGDEALFVVLNPRRLRRVWPALIAMVNRQRIRIPWLGHRRLILSLALKNGRTDPEVPFNTKGSL